MALSPKNWTLSSYTNSTWTDLVGEVATVATLIITNTTGAAINAQVRLEDAAAELSRIVPTTSIAANTAKVLDVRSLNITGTQALQAWADAAGVHFTASGVVSV